MIKKWDAATTTKFVQEYAKHTCLWDVNSNNYKSRAARDDAVLDIVRNMGMSDLHPNDVKCKIRIIRNTYINEMKKIREKKKLVGGKHVNYVCNIPWFKTADQFLRKVVRKKQFPANLVSLDSIDDEYEHSNEHEEYSERRDPACDLLSVTYEADDQSYANRQIKKESMEDSETENTSRCSTFEDEPASSASHSLTFSNLTAEAQPHGSYFSSRSPVTSSNTPYELSTFRRTSSDKHPFNDEVETSLGYTDEFDIFAKNVGVQLRQLPLENALEMQAKIHQLLIDERLKVIRQNKKNGLIIEDVEFDDASDV